jgi:trehalose 6-phosphate synthase/phosphatase
MKNLILVSNRLPIQLSTQDGHTTVTAGSGGLATAVGSVSHRLRSRWIGYLGDGTSPEAVAAAQQQHYHPVAIPRDTYQDYYDHFSNRILWPILHGFAPFDDPGRYWQAYLEANHRFADKVAELAKPKDLIWVHDYQLFLLPALLRERGLTNRIGFFLHTPFPHGSFFADNPYGRRLLDSLLLTDSLGVQTERYFQRLRTSLQGVGARFDAATQRIAYRGRELAAGVFPIGINYQFFSRRPALAPVFYEEPGPKPEATKTLLSLSRLDYTKGIPQQLEAIARLAADPALRGSFVLRLVVIPSREHQPEYQDLKHQIEDRVAQINATYAATGWEPIAYSYASLDPEVLKATYRAADIMLVTPVADGMNLVAKEYLAANARGVLVLSREAGAAEQLRDALLVDPHDPAHIAAAIGRALAMKPPVRATRRLRQTIRQDDVFSWAGNFLRTL